MDEKLFSFLHLSEVFANHGFMLYMVGGTSRDYLLNRDLTDMDLATDANPSDISSFINGVDLTFAKFGNAIILYEGVRFEITTFRKEGCYLDSRHPSKIEFTKNIEEDYLRRDFTINAIYINKDKKVFDFCGGVQDLDNKVIKMIGDPDVRIKEDPLRIVRAIRLAVTLGFSIDKELVFAIKNNSSLLKKLNSQKINQEYKKVNEKDKDTFLKILKDFSIHQYIDVVE